MEINYQSLALDAIDKAEDSIGRLNNDKAIAQSNIAVAYANLALSGKLDTTLGKLDRVIEGQEAISTYFVAMLKHWDVNVPDMPLSKREPTLSQD